METKWFFRDQAIDQPQMFRGRKNVVCTKYALSAGSLLIYLNLHLAIPSTNAAYSVTTQIATVFTEF
jgi:hypothetical protein